MNLKIVGLLAIIPLLSGVTQAQRRSSQDGFRQQYKLILERNIFSRDRRPYVPQRERKTTYRPPPPIETDYCLKGITREHNQLTAFIEQLSTGYIDRYPLNAKIARGTLQTITLDTVEYAMDTAVAANDLTAQTASNDPNDPNDPNAPNTANDPNDPNEPIASIASNDANDINPAEGVKVTKVRIGQTLQGLAPGMTASLSTMIEDWSATAAPSTPTTDTATETEPMDADESDLLKQLMERRRQELAN
jgi:hypothetical protein